MKVGDLVVLSAAGSKTSLNSILQRKTRNWDRYRYGMIKKLTTGYSDGKVLYTVRWFGEDGLPLKHLGNGGGLQNHWRYELKKFKKSE